MRVRGISIVAGIAAIAAAGLLVASPASAATLPAGQKITIVDNIETGENSVWMFNTSPVDATSTPVGLQQAPPNADVFGVDVNDDGFGYAIQNVEDDSDYPVLWTANANTGLLDNPVTIEPPLQIEILLTRCDGIDLQPNGEIIVACVDDSDGLLASYIGVVSTDGTFIPFLADGGEDEVPLVNWTALAFNAVNGELWAFGLPDGGNASGYLVNRAAGTLGPAIPTVVIGGPGRTIFGADFDRDGQLFVTTQASESPIELATLVPSTGAVSSIAEFTTGGDQLLEGPLSLTVWGKPALPATGPVDVLPIGLGTALLFLAGAAFVATGRIQRRSESS